MAEPLCQLLGERLLRPVSGEDAGAAGAQPGPEAAGAAAVAAAAAGAGDLPTASLACEGRSTVGLFFSAQWCPPCRAFTPLLADFYRKLRDRLEVVLVSSDTDAQQWTEHRQHMPWPALPFDDRQRKFNLCRKFKITGIPSLVFLDAKSGRVITKNGVALVSEDPNGLEFPWTPKPFSQVIAGPLLRSSGESVDYSSLEGHFIGMYFAANWCPPCKSFTPMLLEVYRRVRESGKKFEIIFVSSDRSDESFAQYFGEMPWLSVPYADTARRLNLSKLYGIQGIPALVMLDVDRSVITPAARVAIMDDREGRLFPWFPRALSMLSAANAEILNQEPALVLFVDSNEEEELEPVRQMLQPIAEQVIAEYKQRGEEQPLHFFYAGEDDMADSIRDFTALPDCAPLLAILDIPARVKYVKDAEELTGHVISEFVGDYLHGKLQAEPI
ncbi:nucleoredoxin [Petromyzon marinus]|uniref:nucleoredoxin n=1 Tax=Petromyzon marinus TaxID=7757 RepID=UPI003F707FBD